MSLTIVRGTRAEDRAAIGGQVQAAEAALQLARQSNDPERDTLDPVERLELDELAARLRAFAYRLADTG